MNSLRSALNQRAKSKDRQLVNLEAAADANRAVQLLRHAGRVVPLMPTQQARKESKEDQEKRDAHLRSLAFRQAKKNVGRRLQQVLQGISDAQAVARSAGVQYVGPGTMAARDAARHWLRAAVYRQLMKERRTSQWRREREEAKAKAKAKAEARAQAAK